MRASPHVGLPWLSSVMTLPGKWFSRGRRGPGSASSQQRGRSSERLACAFLESRGYQIEATNVRFPIGELDIVALCDRTLCLVEVRSRGPSEFGSAATSITAQKRRRLIRAAQRYLQGRRVPWQADIRFDVVAVDYSPQGAASIQLIQGAFTADEW